MDIFIKKYQPEKYESWKLKSGSIKKQNHSQLIQSQNQNRLLSPLYLNELRLGYLTLSGSSAATRPQTLYQNEIRKAIISKLSSSCSIFTLDSGDLTRHINESVKTATNNDTLARLCSHVLRRLFSSTRDDQSKYATCSKSECEQSRNSCLEPIRKAESQNKKCESSFFTHLRSNSESGVFFSKTNGLWSFQALNSFDLNKKVLEFNELQSLEYPHCSICLLCKLDASLSSSQKQDINARLPINSEILVSEIGFTKKSLNRSLVDVDTVKSEHIDCLLQCRACKLIVHQNCYSGNLDESKLCMGGGPIGKDNWLCDKCIWKKSVPKEPQCCLCLLYGGALKQTEDKQNWAHIVCALVNESASFKYPFRRASIIIAKNAFVQEKKLVKKCVYCHPFTQFKTSPGGLTVKCEMKTCKNRFHVTCGMLHGGCTFYFADGSLCARVLCHEHADIFREELFEKKVFIV